MPHGFDARLSNLTNSEKKIELGFIGNILNKNHSSRVEILNYIIKHYPISLWIGDLNKQNEISPTNLFSKDYFNIKSFNKIINRLITYAKLGEIKKNNQGAVFGIEMYSKLATTLVALNTHISKAGDEAANIRMFESTGLGCCLLTDKKNNIKDFFSEDEVLVYDDKYDAIEKIKYLLNNADIAKKMGQKSMLKTLKFHTVQIRWKKFIEYLNLNF
jgi:spore maturation protein CgeB